ncbi:probable RING finger protein 207 homolog [Mytilus californianus]|uniref:probable RING finger protein 207 homolog n=1 Tax=Mytilus californianus TaxID=6549 RepID=UPI00224742D6|nr:probable RING finger protein 207 homolog [Mytilus californianus]
MTTDTTVCGVCYRRHLNTLPTNWCVECEEALCSDCKEHHIASKATSIHKIIQISEYQSLPSFVTDINQLCVYHNQKYQLHCVKHECAICNKCTKEHGKCGELISLEELVTDIKTSEKFSDLEDSLTDILENFQKHRKDREFNITSIKDQRKTITEELRHLTSRVVQYFEKLEDEFIKELDKNERNCCKSISSVISWLYDKEQEIHQMISETQNIKRYASDLQTFLCMKEIQTKTSENEASLRTMLGNKSLEKIIIESTFDSQVHDILTLKNFGSITLKNIPSSNIDIYRRKDRQAQIMVPKPETSVNSIKYEFKQKIKTSCRNPYGCSVTSRGEFLFSNYDKNNENVLVMNIASEVEYAIPLLKPYSSFDVVYLGNTTCAVSTGYSDEYRGISIVNLNSRKVTKFINLPDDTFGITVRH